MASASTSGTKKSSYIALSTVHYHDADMARGEKQIFRRGEKLRLSDEHAEPLLASKAIRAADKL